MLIRVSLYIGQKHDPMLIRVSPILYLTVPCNYRQHHIGDYPRPTRFIPLDQTKNNCGPPTALKRWNRHETEQIRSKHLFFLGVGTDLTTVNCVSPTALKKWNRRQMQQIRDKNCTFHLRYILCVLHLRTLPQIWR